MTKSHDTSNFYPKRYERIVQRILCLGQVSMCSKQTTSQINPHLTPPPPLPTLLTVPPALPPDLDPLPVLPVGASPRMKGASSTASSRSGGSRAEDASMIVLCVQRRLEKVTKGLADIIILAGAWMGGARSVQGSLYPVSGYKKVSLCFLLCPNFFYLFPLFHG
jgi:hypothetical protein